MTIWINQPGNYSGDTWHIAAAMSLCDTISLVQTVHKRDSKTAQQARAFYSDIGINGSRVLMVPLDRDLEQGLHLSQVASRVEYNHRHKQTAYDALQQYGYAEAELYYVYQATGLYLREAHRNQHSPETLSDAFTKSLVKEYPDAVSAIESRAREIPPNAVLIIGRYAQYLREYDADYSRTSIIVDQAYRHGRPCCLVADASNANAKKISNQLNMTLIDPYSVHKDIDSVSGTKRVDMRGTACFWKYLAQNGRQNLVIGGRSGSVDIAAYLGLDVIEWDVFNADDPESLRLAYMSPSICSTINISKDTGFDHMSHYLVGSSCCTNRTIEMSAQTAMHYALKGNRVTVVHESRMQEYVEV